MVARRAGRRKLAVATAACLAVLGVVEAGPAAPLPPAAAPGPGPLLKAGFPAPVFSAGGTYKNGSTGVLVGDVDGDPELEVLVSGLAAGQITAVEPDGSSIGGWPDRSTVGHQYLSLVEADRARPGLEVAVIEFGDRTAVLDGHGEPLPGWPVANSNFGSQAASVADLDRDGLDELVYNAEDRQYTVRRYDGTVMPGWPRPVASGGQSLSQPALADLDADGTPEIVGGGYGAEGWDDQNLVAFRASGADLPGWPQFLDRFSALHRVAVGQVDSEPGVEVVATTTGSPYHRMHLFRPNGTVKGSWSIYGEADAGPVLADLDEDGDQEIVMGGGVIRAYQGDGSLLPGFPVVASGYESGEPSVVVGDLDNDGHQDIVVALSGESGTVVTALSRDGSPLPGFPLTVPVDADMVPAVADIDGNGRSELLVAGSDGYGWQDGLYAYEYPTGAAAPAAWGQYGGGPRHQFRPGQTLRAEPAPAPGETTQSRIRLVGDTAAGPAGSSPESLTPLGARVVYTADAAASGREVWTSDGTEAGTHRLADVRLGPASSRPGELTRAGTRVFFAASDGPSGRELWSTDGTAAGTLRVADLWAGAPGSDPQELTAVGGRVFFSADGGAGRELWVSDGTAAGTHMVADPTPQPGDATDPEGLARAGDRLVFDGADTVSDPSGTAQLSLFGTDGTESGTVRLSRTSRVYRRVQSGTPYATIEADAALIWTDGTPAGTTLTQAQHPVDTLEPMYGAVSTRGSLGLLAAADGTRNVGAYWARPGSFGALSHRRADGSVVEVRRPADFLPFRTGWIFSAADAVGRELWWSDGSPTGTKRIRDLTTGPSSSDPRPLLTGNGMALLRVTTPTLGEELWRTDGTAAGTSLIADLASGRRGSGVTEAVVVGDRILLVGDDGRSGRELWTMPLSLLGPLPDTTVTGKPRSPTRDRSATVRFHSNVGGSRFLCRFDALAARACSSPWRRTVGKGRHRLEISATAPNGLREVAPAVVRWRVRR